MDTVSAGVLEDNCPSGSTEKRVGLQLCFVASTLACHGFGSRIYLARFLEMTAAPSKVGWMPSYLFRLGASFVKGAAHKNIAEVGKKCT